MAGAPFFVTDSGVIVLTKLSTVNLSGRVPVTPSIAPLPVPPSRGVVRRQASRVVERVIAIREGEDYRTLLYDKTQLIVARKSVRSVG